MSQGNCEARTLRPQREAVRAARQPHSRGMERRPAAPTRDAKRPRVEAAAAPLAEEGVHANASADRDEAALAAALPSDAEVAFEALRREFPSAALGNLPALVLQSQMRALVADATALERDLDVWRQEGRVRLVRLPGRVAIEFLLVEPGEYARALERAAPADAESLRARALGERGRACAVRRRLIPSRTRSRARTRAATPQRRDSERRAAGQAASRGRAVARPPRSH